MKSRMAKCIVKSVIVLLLVLIGTLAIRHGLTSGKIDKMTLLQICFMLGGTVGIIIGILLE